MADGSRGVPSEAVSRAGRTSFIGCGFIQRRATAPGLQRLRVAVLVPDPPTENLPARRGYQDVRRFVEMAHELHGPPSGVVRPDGAIGPSPPSAPSPPVTAASMSPASPPERPLYQGVGMTTELQTAVWEKRLTGQHENTDAG